MTQCSRCKRRLKAKHGDLTDIEKPICTKCLKSGGRMTAKNAAGFRRRGYDVKCDADGRTFIKKKEAEA